MFKLKSIKDENVTGKKVFLRADLDVPIANGKISDDSRLKAWFPTLEYLLTNQAQVYLAGHLGRPEGREEKLSLRPVVKWILGQLELHSDLKEFDLNGIKGFATTSGVSVLENLRFYKEEEADDSDFSKKLASLADIYVNDAFASSHRSHASIVGVPKLLPHFAGLRLIKEVEELSKALVSPKRPLTIIIGGAKIETKLPLVERMHKFADYVLVGGEIAEQDRVLAKVSHEKNKEKKSILLIADLTTDKKDITEHSTQNFIEVINSSKTIVWNGPVGLVEECFDQGTREIAHAMAKSSGYTIVGGGDTVAFLEKEGIADKFSFTSIGGGAMLEFLAGIKLPGLEVLEK